MWSTAREIAAGDLVIVWLTRELVQPLLVTPGKEFNGRYGVYRHADLVGVPYGSKVGSRNGRGFIHVLRPTPELWTMALPHRTQILYLADIAFITSWLGIRPGSRVVEAGTGSGSFSHSVTRTIGPSGRLYSYEFHEARANKAREEFARHGMADIVTLTHRNVCKDGFTVTDEADAVFLDLPAPWEAVQHAKATLRKDRTARICCFSPCMEQVLRTVSALNEHGFTEITMYETLLRPHEVHTVPVLQSIAEVGAQLKEAEAKREEKRLRQIAAAAARRAQNGGKSSRAKRKRDGAGDDKMEEAPGGDTTREESGSKRVRVEDAGADETAADGTPGVTGPPADVDADMNTATQAADDGPTAIIAPTDISAPAPTSEMADVAPAKVNVSKVMTEVRGHTSYLTFAVLLPAIFSGSDSPTEATADADNSGQAQSLPGTSDGPDVP